HEIRGPDSRQRAGALAQGASTDGAFARKGTRRVDGCGLSDARWLRSVESDEIRADHHAEHDGCGATLVAVRQPPYRTLLDRPPRLLSGEQERRDAAKRRLMAPPLRGAATPIPPPSCPTTPPPLRRAGTTRRCQASADGPPRQPSRAS